MSVDIFKNISKSGGFDLVITHLPTLVTVSFPGFITNFSDTYNADFSSEKVYGRMDPIVTYNGTGRQVSAVFDVIAESLEAAKENMQKFAIFSKMMYPKFARVDESDTLSLKSPPLLKIRYANLIKDAFSDDGLLGAARSADMTPSFEHGFFAPVDEPGVLYPKKYSIDVSFEVLHTHEIGWDEENNWLGGDEWPHSIPSTPGTAQSSSPGTILETAVDNTVIAARTGLLTGEFTS